MVVLAIVVVVALKFPVLIKGIVIAKVIGDQKYLTGSIDSRNSARK